MPYPENSSVFGFDGTRSVPTTNFFTASERKTVAEHSVVGSEHRPQSGRRLSADSFRRSGWKPLPRDFFTASERNQPARVSVRFLREPWAKASG